MAKLTAEDEEAIQKNMDRFDFDKVLAYMKLVEWDGNPTKEQIRVIALQLMTSACRETDSVKEHVGTGLIAYSQNGVLELQFHIERKAFLIGGFK